MKATLKSDSTCDATRLNGSNLRSRIPRQRRLAGPSTAPYSEHLSPRFLVTDFPESELDRLPYVDFVPTDGRRVLIQVPYFDPAGSEWHLYFRPQKGMIGRIAGGEPVYGSYFAREPQDVNRDLELPISTLVTQRLSFGGLPKRLGLLEHDVHNCAAILEKYEMISAMGAERGTSQVLVATEIEYLLTLVRAMFDLLNLIVAEAAQLFVNKTNNQKIVKNSLPDSFARVALNGEELRTGDEIVAKYKLPAPVANWYVIEAPTFRLLRATRDHVIHHGQKLPTVFDLPGYGLAVEKDTEPWSQLDIWKGVETVNQRLVPLRLVFLSVVGHAVGASSRLADALTSSADLPTPLGSGIRVFLRSAVSRRLVAIPTLVDRPWERMSY